MDGKASADVCISRKQRQHGKPLKNAALSTALLPNDDNLWGLPAFEGVQKDRTQLVQGCETLSQIVNTCRTSQHCAHVHYFSSVGSLLKHSLHCDSQHGAHVGRLTRVHNPLKPAPDSFGSKFITLQSLPNHGACHWRGDRQTQVSSRLEPCLDHSARIGKTILGFDWIVQDFAADWANQVLCLVHVEPRDDWMSGLM
eukprot:3935322-Rhodomonas_salina.3